MRCTFCATGKGGFARNLKAHEIVDQVMTVQEEFGTRVSNIGGAICDILQSSCKMQISMVYNAGVMHSHLALTVTALRSHQAADNCKDPNGKQSLCSAAQICLLFSDQEDAESPFLHLQQVLQHCHVRSFLGSLCKTLFWANTSPAKETVLDMVTNAICCKESLCSTAVFMGMGEPLLNLPSVMRAHTMLNENLGVGQRHITISTVGVPNAIMKLASHNLQSTLAISIHAPNQQLREQLVPRCPTLYALSVCLYCVSALSVCTVCLHCLSVLSV